MKFNKLTVLFTVFWGLMVVANPKIQSMDSSEYENLESSISRAELTVKENLEKEKFGSTRVIVLGVSGSGKSTLVHSLANQELCVRKVTGRFSIDIPAGKEHLPGFKIGGGLGSVTRIPTAWIDDVNNLTYWDCPGFMDSAGAAQEIINAFAIDQLFKEPNRVKIILTLQASDFDGLRGMAAIDNLSKLSMLLPETDQLKKGTCLVITKNPDDGFSVQDKLLGLLEKAREYVNVESRSQDQPLKVSLDLLESFVKPGRTFSFPASIKEGPYTLFEDRPKLIENLRKDSLQNPTHSISIGMDDPKVVQYMSSLMKKFGNVGGTIVDFVQQFGEYKKKKIDNTIIITDKVDYIQEVIHNLETWKRKIEALLIKLPTIHCLKDLIDSYQSVFNDEKILSVDLLQKAKSIDNFVNFAKRIYPYSVTAIEISEVLKPSLENMKNEIELLIKGEQAKKDHAIQLQEMNTKVKEGQIKQEEADKKIKVIEEDFRKTASELKKTQSILDNAKEEAKLEIERAIKTQQKENDKQILDLKKQLEEAKASLGKVNLEKPRDASSLVELMSLLRLLSPGGGCGGGGMPFMGGGMPSMGGGMPSMGGGMPSMGGGMPSMGGMPSGGRSFGAGSGGHSNAGMVHVSGYTRSNGTQVAPYWRAGPGKGR